MSRWMLFGTVMLAAGPAGAADLPQSDNGIYSGPPRHSRRIVAETKSDLLFTPSSAFPEIHFAPHTPILLGAATLPGYYGSNHSYEDQGPYYGGSNLGYRFRLPYACRVLGYSC